MESRGLLFIPDISGFTRFVTETEIDHSRRIIQELLEAVIDANRIGLEVSEVEGDAVLFYRFGDAPDFAQLSDQVAVMFRAFHERLGAYEIGHFCQCRACRSAGALTLKVITHFGEFTNYRVRQFDKLIGKDVIVAHQLLKNDIDHHEYWLVTTSVLRDRSPAEPPSWIMWNRGVQRTEGGEITFDYTPLTELRQALPRATLPDLGLPRSTRMFSASRDYEAHIITMFHALGFRYRHKWQEGVRSVEEVSHFLPRVGTRTRRETDDGPAIVFASSLSFQPDRIAFSETDEDRLISWSFTLESLEEYRTRLTVDCHVRKGLFGELRFRLTKKRRLEASLKRSLVNLDEVAKAIDVPVEY